MTPSKFAALEGDLEKHIRSAIEEFFEARGMAYDHQAYLKQRTGSYKHAIREVIMFGADEFPLTPEEGDEPIKLPELLMRLLENPSVKVGIA